MPWLEKLHGAIAQEDSMFILTVYPSATGTMWLRIECKGRVSKMDSGLFNNPFITLCCDGSSVTLKFCVFFQLVATGSLDTGCFLSFLK